jgi:hypothetical protein
MGGMYHAWVAGNNRPLRSMRGGRGEAGGEAGAGTGCGLARMDHGNQGITTGTSITLLV